MSDTEQPKPSRKRKLSEEDAIAIDLNAPEPPSKRALRKEKKDKLKTKAKPTTADATPNTATEDLQPQTQETTEKQQRSGFGIWIGNLLFSTKRDDLRTFFTTTGSFQSNEITRIHVPESDTKQKGVRRNKGFAYIDFVSAECVARALKLSEELLGGRRVLIKDATDFKGRPDKTQTEENGTAKPRQGTVGNPPSRKIFVGNLAFDSTKESLEQHFSPCGSIAHIHVATFEDSGKCKGYAWVEFEDTESAEAAVRGFVKVVDDDDYDDDDNEEEENVDENEDIDADNEKASKQQKKKKPKMKKVWVNRMLGRALRMEFAEDQATRYKKRYGKEGKEGKANEVTSADSLSEGTSRPRGFNKPYNSNNRSSGESGTGKYNTRYSQETVQRLSGAIVEAKGQKTTFD